jgi:dolichol-phosphate mannosyltransferase
VITVIFPAYDEAGVIGPALAALGDVAAGEAESYRAILVDDGSTDGTVAEAEAAVASLGLPLIVLRHPTNMGLGAGLRTGIYHCLDESSADDDVIVTLDADGTHPPALIPQLVAELRRGHDLVVASRFQAGASVTGVPFFRQVLSDGGRLVFRIAFPIRGLRDYTCCFRAYRMGLLRDARRAYGDDLVTARGFEAVLDLVLRLRPLEPRIAEIPLHLDYGPRVGRSKMHVVRTIRRTLVLIATRWIERWTTDSPKRVRARVAAAR